jgi:hypothetical protein
MKRVIAITAISVVAFAAFANAQSSSTSLSRPLAEVAKDEEARRKSVRKPAKVYTNGSLKQDFSAGVAPAPSAEASAAPGNASPSNASPSKPAADAPPSAAQAKDQAYWQGRIKAARDQVTRTQMFADSLQTRINSLMTDFINRDDPAQKAKLEQDRKAALAELEKVKKELEEQTKTISAIEDEARRAGVPSGWLRPGA